MSMNMKGQAAMEYLMTYGWAILIVIIVAAALWALGVFNPATWQQASATGFAGFQVPTGGWVVNSTGVHVLLKNTLGATVAVTAINATVNGVISTTSEPLTATLAANGQQWFAMSGGITVPAAGSAYSIAVAVSYTYSSTGASGQSTGQLTGTAV
jgi:energy-converting hydrogenase Eha subunit A